MNRNLSERASWWIILWVAASALVLTMCSGCVVVGGQYRAADGSTLRVRTYRLLWMSEAVEFGTTNKDLSASLRLLNSRPDAQALRAVAQGVAEGMK